MSGTVVLGLLLWTVYGAVLTFTVGTLLQHRRRHRPNPETVRHIQIHRASLTRTEPPVPIRESGIVVGFTEPPLVGDFTSDIQAELDRIEAEAAELPYTMMTDDEWESL